MTPSLFVKTAATYTTAFTLSALPSIALAQATGTDPSISSGTNGGTAACTAIVNSASAGAANGTLAGIAVFLSGTPFRVGAFIGIVMAAMVLLLDSGHLPQIAQRVLQSLLVIVVVGVVIGFIFNPTNALAQC